MTACLKKVFVSASYLLLILVDFADNPVAPKYRHDEKVSSEAQVWLHDYVVAMLLVPLEGGLVMMASHEITMVQEDRTGCRDYHQVGRGKAALYVVGVSLEGHRRQEQIHLKSLTQ